MNNIMTKFEELMDMISRKKNTDSQISDYRTKEELEVAGSESSKTPLLSTGDDQTDPDLIDQLYSQAKWRNIPNRGENASSWDD